MVHTLPNIQDDQTSEMLWHCSSHPPVCWSHWAASDFRLNWFLFSFTFEGNTFPGSCFFILKTRPCCSSASIRHAAALHTDTWPVCFPHCPEGSYGLVCLAQQVSHIRPRCCETSTGGLGSERGCGFTSGQNHIDLRSIGSMLSAAARGGSTRECQCAISRSRLVLQAEKHLGVILRKH